MASDMRKTPANHGVEPSQTPTPANITEAQQGVKPLFPDDEPTRARCAIIDVSKVDFGISPKWRKRLKQLEDYQRAAPFVLGHFTLD